MTGAVCANVYVIGVGMAAEPAIFPCPEAEAGGNGPTKALPLLAISPALRGTDDMDMVSWPERTLTPD